MTTTDETIKNTCCECNTEVDVDGDYGWSNVKEDYLCLGCRESDESSVSTVSIADAGRAIEADASNRPRGQRFQTSDNLESGGP